MGKREIESGRARQERERERKFKTSLQHVIYFPCRVIANYVHILLRVLRRDILQFSAVFCAALFAFGGGFYFALRSEVGFVFDEATNKTIFLSDLDIHPEETG